MVRAIITITVITLLTIIRVCVEERDKEAERDLSNRAQICTASFCHNTSKYRCVYVCERETDRSREN